MHIGDIVKVRNLSSNAGMEKGEYDLEIIDEDNASIAVSVQGGTWWFYRDTLESYVGNAIIVVEP